MVFQKKENTEQLTADFHPDERLAQEIADVHDNMLPNKKVVIVFLALALSMTLSFIDQASISVALPSIADDLKAQETISWAGTSALIANTVFMGIVGRLSDIFGRKYVLIGCVLCLGFANLACGFAQTAYQFFIFRGFCGIGAGGITGLAMVIVSDVVSLERRGLFQGILGSCVGLGSAIGPFLCSVFIEHLTWRKFYFFMAPITIVSSLVQWWLVPFTYQKVNVKEKLLQIDYLGIFTSSVGIIFLLIPVSGGGSTFKWNSAFVISFLAIGGCSSVLFILVEKKFARLPLIPTHLFTTRASLTFLLTQSFFFGMCQFSMIYYIPYYFLIVRGFSMMKSSIYLLGFILPLVFASIISGQLISRTKRYLPVIWIGYSSWTLGFGLLLALSTSSKNVQVIFTLIIVGTGVGSTMQPTLVASQAHSYRKDRATVISARNLLRSFGGAVGLAICSSILSNTFIRELKLSGGKYFNQDEIAFLSKQIFSSILLKSLPTQQADFLKELYMKALKNVFYFWLGSMVYCLLSTLSVKDRGLDPIDAKVEEVKPTGQTV